MGADSETVNGHSLAGAAYLFNRVGTTWSQQAELSAVDAATDDILGSSVALAGTTCVMGASGKTVGGQEYAGAVYVDVVMAPPSLRLKAAPQLLQVAKQLTLSGLVEHFLDSDMTVRIERKVGSGLTVLKTLPLTPSGAFTWTTKPDKAGSWVFVAAYKAGRLTYLSKPVSVKVQT